MGGLLAFIVLNQRGDRARRATSRCATPSRLRRSCRPRRRRSVALGDEVRGGLHAPVGSSHRSRAVAASPARRRCGRARRGRRPRRGRRRCAALVEERREALLGAGHAVRGVERGEQAVAERGLLATAGGAVPRGRRLERGPRRGVLPERAQDAAEVDAGERGQPHVAGGLGLVDRELRAWPRRPRSRRPGTARVRGWRAGRPRSAGSRAAVTSRPRGRGAGRRRRSGARRGRARRASRRGGRGATGRRPAASQCSTWSRASTRARVGRRRRSRRGRRRASSRPGPTAGRARRRARRCGR